MKDECRTNASAASGKEISDKDALNYERRMAWARGQARNADPRAWAAMSDQQKILATKDVLIANVRDNALRLTANETRNRQIFAGSIKSMFAHDTKFKRGAADALLRQIDAPLDGKNIEGNTSLAASIQARRDAALGDFAHFFNKVGRKWLGLFQDKDAYRAFLWESRGQDSSEFADPKKLADIRKYAKMWRDGAETWRQLANSVGSNIGKIENYVFPQSYVRENVIKDSAETFVKKIDPLLDKNAYLDDNGVPLSDEARQKILRGIHENFLDNDNSGFGSDSRIAGRHSQRRVLQYKDADSYIEAMNHYGDTNVANAMLTHATKMSRDIELMNKFGSNPDAMIESLKKYAEEHDRANRPAQDDNTKRLLAKSQLVYDYLSGRYAQTYGSKSLADFSEAARNVMTALHIGSYPIKHISDIGRMYGNMIYNDANWLHLLREQLSSFNPLNSQYRDMIEASGVGLERYTKEVSAYGNDLIGPLWSQKLAKFFVSVTGGPAFQAANKRAYSSMLFNLMDRLVTKYDSVSKFGADDQRLMNSAGITDKELAIFRLAERETDGNRKFLTPRSVKTISDEKIDALIPDKIAEINASEDKNNIPQKLLAARDEIRGEASRKLLALANEETNMSIIKPSATTQAVMRDIAKRGTVLGEIAGSSLQFKNFIVSLGSRMVDRFNSIPTGAGRAMYATRLAAVNLATGSVVATIEDLLAGKDPSFALTGKNLLKWSSYGGFTIINEFLDKMSQANSVKDSIGDAAEFALGPVAGTMFQAAAIPVVSAFAKPGKEAETFKKEGAKFIKSNFPFREWYTKAVIDRMLNRELMENANPGGVNRSAQRLRQETGQGYFWNPVDANPATGIKREPRIVTKSPNG